MGHHIGVAKAAHLLGIERNVLQRMIRRGDLHTFEGMLDVEELRSRYPLLAMDDESELERVRLIKKTAFSRRVTSTVMPETDELEQRLARRTADLALARAKEQQYRTLLEDLAQTLCDMLETEDQKQRDLVNLINRWLVERLEKARV